MNLYDRRLSTLEIKHQAAFQRSSGILVRPSIALRRSTFPPPPPPHNNNTQAKHTIVGARTERIESDPHFAGLQVTGAPVTLVEGGQVATLVLTATVPVLCSPQVLESCFSEQLV